MPIEQGPCPAPSDPSGGALPVFTLALTAGDPASAVLPERADGNGHLHLTQIRQDGRFVIRVQAGSFDCRAQDVAMIAQVVAELKDT